MPTPNMGLTLPTEGGDNGTWDEKLNDALDLVDAHDHSTGKGAKVTQAGINLTGDLEFNGGSGTELRSVEFSLVASSSMTGRVRGLWWNSADSELYIRTNSGTDIKLTSSGTLNISIAGGIGGDYGSVSALLDYDDAADTYRLRQQVGAAVRQFARAATAGVDLYEYKGHPTAGVPVTRVRLSSPAGLGASYELVFAGALPGSTQLMQVSAAGVLTYSNTIANAVTMSALLTANAGVTAAVDQHFTVSGNGRFKHGEMKLPIPLCAGHITNGTFTYTDAGVWDADTVNATLDLPLSIPVGARFKSAAFTLDNTGVGTITLSLLSSTGGGAPTTVASTTRVGGAGWSVTTLTSTQTIADATSYILRIFCNNAAHRISGCVVTWDWA